MWICWLDKVTKEVLRRENEDGAKLKIFGKGKSMDWPCFQTRLTFAWNYWRQNKR